VPLDCPKKNVENDLLWAATSDAKGHLMVHKNEPLRMIFSSTRSLLPIVF